MQVTYTSKAKRWKTNNTKLWKKIYKSDRNLKKNQIQSWDLANSETWLVITLAW